LVVVTKGQVTRRKCGILYITEERGLDMGDKKKIYYERGTQELRMKNIRAHKLVQLFNNCAIEDSRKKEEIIKELFGTVGVNPSIEP
jgi:hypothetical protein